MFLSFTFLPIFFLLKYHIQLCHYSPLHFEFFWLLLLPFNIFSRKTSYKTFPWLCTPGTTDPSCCATLEPIVTICALSAVLKQMSKPDRSDQSTLISVQNDLTVSVMTEEKNSETEEIGIQNTKGRGQIWHIGGTKWGGRVTWPCQAPEQYVSNQRGRPESMVLVPYGLSMQIALYLRRSTQSSWVWERGVGVWSEWSCRGGLDYENSVRGILFVLTLAQSQGYIGLYLPPYID